MEQKTAASDHHEQIVVPLAREELHVGTRRVDEVKRVPVDRVVPLDQAPATRQEGDTLIVPVFEEIHITGGTRQEQYAGTVVPRAEQVTVEGFDNDTGTQAAPTDGGSHHATISRSRI